MVEHTNFKKIYWILRIATAGCFIGHGAFGLMKKPAWLAYYAVFHVSPEWADKFFLVIGTMDILLGISALVYPCWPAFLWMTLWGVFTAFLRPLAGEGFWEFFERAGNYGTPLALLVLIKEHRLTQTAANQLILILKYSTGLLLIGHGGFGAFMHKEMLLHHFASVGLHLSQQTLVLIGWFEITLGLLVIMKPLRPILIFIVIWKIGTELLYPISGAPIWEFIERFGSYGAPFALFLLLPRERRSGT